LALAFTSRYWAATTVTEVSLSAVSCGDVVAHVTVSPAVFVEHVYPFGPPVESAAETATLPDPVLGITGLTVNVIESMFAGVVAFSV
jgi:hypothetical protein